MKISIKINWHDWWIGVFWRRLSDRIYNPAGPDKVTKITQIYICIIFCLPICLTFGNGDPELLKRETT